METINSWPLYFFKQANLVAWKSKDPSSKVGTVVVRDHRVISSGYNAFCIGVKDLPERYNDRPTKYRLVAHSEFNACIIASRFGISLMDTELYTQSLPCDGCTKAIIQAGISKIHTLKSCDELWEKYNPDWNESCEFSKLMLTESGVVWNQHDIVCDDEVLIGGKKYRI